MYTCKYVERETKLFSFNMFTNCWFQECSFRCVRWWIQKTIWLMEGGMDSLITYTKSSFRTKKALVTLDYQHLQFLEKPQEHSCCFWKSRKNYCECVLWIYMDQIFIYSDKLPWVFTWLGRGVGSVFQEPIHFSHVSIWGADIHVRLISIHGSIHISIHGRALTSQSSSSTIVQTSGDPEHMLDGWGTFVTLNICLGNNQAHF